METLEQTIPDARAVISQKFDQLIGGFENQLKEKVRPETAEKFQNYFPELIRAFDELKQNLAERLNAIEPEKYKYLPIATKELNELLSVVLDMAENGLANFKLVNCAEGGKIISSVLTKGEGDEEKTKVVFNFEPTGHSQARVAINIGERLSFRIDHVPENKEKNIKEALYIDLDTPGMNELLDRIKDEHGNWHHFESRALKDFTDNEKFRELAEFIKQMLTEAGEHQEFTIENLVEKFKTK